MNSRESRSILLALGDAWAEDGFKAGEAFATVLQTEAARALFTDASRNAIRERERGTEEWGAGDIKCAREALGLSQQALAEYLPWRSSRISECESGRRQVHGWVMDRIKTLELLREELIQIMYEECVHEGATKLVVELTDEEYLVSHPAGPVMPASTQRVAAAIVAARVEKETGVRPKIVIRA